LISMDNKAGVKEILYSINQGPFKKYTKPFYLSQAGNLTIETLAIDNVNNKSRSKTLTDRSHVSYVDISGPKLNHHFHGPKFKSKDTTFITKNTKIQLSGQDDESGFNKIEYRIGAQKDFKVYDTPFSIEDGGSYSVQYNGYDNLGNTSNNEFLCLVDNKEPEIFHRFSMISNSIKNINGKKYKVFPDHVVLFLSATDDCVGFDKMNYSINGNSKQPYNSLIEGFNRNTKYELKVTATDKLGNQYEKEIHFYIE